MNQHNQLVSKKMIQFKAYKSTIINLQRLRKTREKGKKQLDNSSTYLSITFTTLYNSTSAAVFMKFSTKILISSLQPRNSFFENLLSHFMHHCCHISIKKWFRNHYVDRNQEITCISEVGPPRAQSCACKYCSCWRIFCISLDIKSLFTCRINKNLTGHLSWFHIIQ